MSGLFARIAGWAIANRRAVVVASVFLTLIGVVAASRLDTDAGTATLVDDDSETFAATERLHEEFGDEAIAILVRGDLERLVLTEDLGQLLAIEGCLAGNVPQTGPPPAPECEELARLDPVRVVYGPATFLNQSAIQAEAFLNSQAAAAVQEARGAYTAAVAESRREGFSKADQRLAGIAAAQEVLGRFEGELRAIALQTGQIDRPSLDNPVFVESVVFDSRLPAGTPKARFSVFFPSPDAAQILVRLEPDLDPAERAEAIELVRGAVADPAFALDGGDYVVSGVPVVVDELAEEFRGEVFILLACALAVMTVVLTVVFGRPLRLLPLALALFAGAIAFGTLSLSGESLTMASIAVLPVLIGLAVDYAIQYQARQREMAASGAAANRAARSAAVRGGPVIAAAACATAAGFLVLLLSPVPMVRGFGWVLVVGIAAALVAVFTVGVAVLSSPRRPDASRVAGDGAAAAGAPRLAARALALGIAAPARVVLVSLALAACGWALGSGALGDGVEVESDLRQLVPASVLEDAGADELQEETGVSGELNVVVNAPDVADPEVIRWMADLKERVLEEGGFSGESASCEQARICPQIAITDLFGDSAPSAREVRTLLQAIPPYFAQALIAGGSAGSGDAPPPTTANLAFGIRLMPLDEQKELIDSIRAEIDPPGTASDPPPGVDAHVAGLPALAADANAELADSRHWLTLAGLAAVALVLLVLYRSATRALVPLVPVALATGWSQLVIFASGIPLNPMSATLGALVIAIATEFSVILSARYREQRARGQSIGEALRITYSRTGAAVLASGITAIAGFAVLPLAAPVEALFGGGAIPMLTDFGLVTVIDLAVALLGVLLVLPAALVWAERDEPRVPARGGLRDRMAAVPARRRRPGDRDTERA